MQSDLNALSKWLIVDNLELNVKKTKNMAFHYQHLTPFVDLSVYVQLIENVTNFKFLGVFFFSHFRYIYDKLLQSSFVFQSLSKLLPISCMRSLYFAYFHSHITYAMIIWYPIMRKNLQTQLHCL